MSEPLVFLFPLISAIVYVVAAMLIKRAGDYKPGAVRITLVCNLVCAVIFQVLLVFGGTFHGDLLWQPALVAVLFVAGQGLTFLSLQVGDVSIATPVLSLKVVMVAFLSTFLLGDAVPLKLWIASALCALGVTLLSRSENAVRGRIGITILYAAGGAAFFALFDVLVMKWAPFWGLGRFLPVMLLCTAALSLLIFPFCKTSLRETPAPAWKWMIGGGALFAMQSVLFVGTLAASGKGTVVNILYGTRGLWSVVLVWMAGRYFSSVEQMGGRRMVLWRLMGAAFMAAAVILIFV